MRIRKSRYVESDGTYCCIGKFNVALSLCRILGIALYFFEGFSKVTAGISAVTKALWPLGVTMVCFLGQESNLQSFALQQRHRLFLRCFLHLLLVNLPLLASLEERFTHRELDCFLGVENNDLNEDSLVDKAIRDMFALFQKTIILPVKKALSCFQE